MQGLLLKPPDKLVSLAHGWTLVWTVSLTNPHGGEHGLAEKCSLDHLKLFERQQWVELNKCRQQVVESGSKRFIVRFTDG